MKKGNHSKIDFVGIGAAKCATSWVYRCLFEHPNVCCSKIKELHYFLTENPKSHPMDGNMMIRNRTLFNRGIDSYLEYFDHCDNNSIKGEISVSYISDPGAAKKIYESFPDIKIIVCLRNPIKRAHSYYLFSKKFLLKEKSNTFEDALNKNEEIYINGGKYYEQLKTYFDVFPKENIGIFITDDLNANPIKFIQAVYSFLGVNSSFVPPSALRKENSARKVRCKFLKKIQESLVKSIYSTSNFFGVNFLIQLLKKIGFQKMLYYFNWKINSVEIVKEKIKPETYERLRDEFRDDVLKLEKLIGRNLESWR